MSQPIRDVNAVLELNPQAACEIANQLADYSTKGEPCQIRYSSEQNRICVLPVRKEQGLRLTHTKEGEAKTKAFSRFVVWPRFNREQAAGPDERA